MRRWREDPALPRHVRAVLYALMAYMDAEGEAWPSLATLARDTGTHRRTVIRNLRAAAAAGWIAPERRGGSPGDSWRSTIYRIAHPPSDTHATTLVTRAPPPSGQAATTLVTQAPPELPPNPQGTPTTPQEEMLSLRDAPPPPVRDLVGAVEDGDVDRLVEFLQIPGWDVAEAQWVLDVTDLPAQEARRTLSWIDEPGWHADLVATSLRDLQRKGGQWSRERWLAYLVAAFMVRRPEYREFGVGVPQLAAGCLWEDPDGWKDVSTMADVLARLSPARSSPRPILQEASP